ncbi:OB-fold nucleic acid binding domain protein [Methanobrevibacter cuticularis]|uniref:OB-fold nucleic acid binding domain protein n=1 Tax=Methanobrevibacter cuticularis TaxID=47311 RepID=A0A166DMX5_9EURY|nr:OB-fold nucleic acid binding domain-containing protein [Methanobrevibacter cuticularis]KZX15771.1 OB-fold nucleic acid binding domain protein [Methanobrevibacter cuticularis]
MEITDEKIFKVALITSLIGIVGMLIFAGGISPKEIAIENIDKGSVDEEVAILGVIDSIKESSSGKSYFLTLNDGTGRINIIVFESTVVEFQEEETDINNFKNKRVKVIGTLTQYNGEMELILANSQSIKIEN